MSTVEIDYVQACREQYVQACRGLPKFIKRTTEGYPNLSRIPLFFKGQPAGSKGQDRIFGAESRLILSKTAVCLMMIYSGIQLIFILAKSRSTFNQQEDQQE